ncbi:hypothetical protein D3C71_1361380 [compost metagenome]
MFVRQHVTLATGIEAGRHSCSLLTTGNGRGDFQPRVTRRCSGCVVAGGLTHGSRIGNGRLRNRCARLPPLRGLLAHDAAGFCGIHPCQFFLGRRTQHRALLEQVDVAANEGLRVGTHQRNHVLVQRVAVLAGKRVGDLRQALPALHRGQLACCARHGCHRRPCSLHGGRWRYGCWRWRSDWLRCGGRCLRKRLGLADDQVGRRGGGRFDHRLGDRRSGLRRGDQCRVLTHQAPLPPVHFNQETHRRHLHRGGAGHTDDRTTFPVLRELELQFAHQSVR